MNKAVVATLSVAAVVLGACGRSPVESVAPTPETIAFLRLDPSALRGCVDVEGVIVDAVAGAITGQENDALASQVDGAVRRCGAVARLIDVASYPAPQRPRAEACRTAFTTKVEAYTALNRAAGAEGDFMTAQQGTREFLSKIRASTPQMRTCNTPAA